MKAKFTFATTSAIHTVSVIKEVNEVGSVTGMITQLTPEESTKIILKAKLLAEMKTKGKFRITYLKGIEDKDVE